MGFLSISTWLSDWEAMAHAREVAGRVLLHGGILGFVDAGWVSFDGRQC
jgi:hypothetical protein